MRRRKGGRTAGFILVDVIAALAVAAVGLTVVIAGVALGARVAEIASARAHHLVVAENALSSYVGAVLTIKK